jgi:hypothetical protein
MSLEDIFMQLTRDEPQPPAVTDDGLAAEPELDSPESA